ncbi:MAG TPA: ROK family protein, partial [Capillimicrobium sp.]
MDRKLIGVDVGGTKVSVAVLSGATLGEPQLQPTDTSSAAALIDQLVAAVERAAGGEAVDAVGVGIPSVVDWATGCARSSVNIPLQDVPLRDELEARLGVPVFVDNDANCAGLAEAHGPDGTVETSNLVIFTVGTGVGGGIVIDGRVYRGITGAAPEIGHMVIGADAAAAGP